MSHGCMETDLLPMAGVALPVSREWMDKPMNDTGIINYPYPHEENKMRVSQHTTDQQSIREKKD